LLDGLDARLRRGYEVVEVSECLGGEKKVSIGKLAGDDLQVLQRMPSKGHNSAGKEDIQCHVLFYISRNNSIAFYSKLINNVFP